MKRLFAILLLLSSAAFAQNLYQFGTVATSLSAVTTTGPGSAFALSPQAGSFPNAFTWLVTVNSNPTSEVVNLEGSIDNVNWFTLSTISSADAGWVSGQGELVHVVYKPVRFLRCNVSSYTPNGSNTSCYFIGGRL